jgi:hypothetical protein
MKGHTLRHGRIYFAPAVDLSSPKVAGRTSAGVHYFIGDNHKNESLALSPVAFSPGGQIA